MTDSVLLTEGDEFSFDCHPGLACFNRCCQDVNIYLTPIDIVEMRRALGLTSSEFLKRHAFPLFPRAIGHPVVLLRMSENEKMCSFAGPEGCRIYTARPWSCRSFPLEPVERPEGKRFRVEERPFCLGLKEKRSRSVADWRDTQDVRIHEAVNDLWSMVTHHPGVGRANLLEGTGRDMFFLGSYNPDEFRRMVLESSFLDHFEVDPATVEAVRTDDIELLGLAFRWLRTVLFGDEALPRKKR